ncbi:MAG: hypothetical protein ACHQHP_00775 [Bacteroidia bacterium]
MNNILETSVKIDGGFLFLVLLPKGIYKNPFAQNNKGVLMIIRTPLSVNF